MWRYPARFSDTKQGDRAIWVDHKPRTFLGFLTPDMPNIFMVLGPHQPFGNGTRSLENAVDVVCNLLQHCSDNTYTFVVPKEEAVEAWGEHVVECSKGALSNEVDSWMTGVNTNFKDKTQRGVARYTGNVVQYRKRCTDCHENGWNRVELCIVCPGWLELMQTSYLNINVFCVNMGLATFCLMKANESPGIVTACPP